MAEQEEMERLLNVIEEERKVLGQLRKSEKRRADEVILNEQNRAEKMENKAKELQQKVDMLNKTLKGTKRTGDTLSNRLYWLNWLVALGTVTMAISALITLWVQLFPSQ
jgi:hypothetical protein